MGRPSRPRFGLRGHVNIGCSNDDGLPAVTLDSATLCDEELPACAGALNKQFYHEY